MYHRLLRFAACALVASALVACTNKHVQNPIAQVDSKQPDKVLFDRAMDAMKHNRYDVARISLQTLINTYPDSEYVARSMLAVGDSWYNEGDSASLTQAQNQYKDFQVFFPNMPEAVEAQMKVAEIEFRQMEKPDRDFTHAKQAEDEYRALILKYPDSKLVTDAKQRLREVQEVLAEREFDIGRFYYLRESYPASIARMQSLVDAYPLYSGADESLFMIGEAYERQAERSRKTLENPKFNEKTKEGVSRMIGNFEDHEAEAYAHLITRYPLSPRATSASERLEALKRPVPKATAEAVAQNRAEMESRGRVTMMQKVSDNFKRHPETALASKVGEPPLVEPKGTGAPDIVRSAGLSALGKEDNGKHALTIDTNATTGAPPPNEPAPRSDEPPKPSDPNAIGELSPNPTPAPADQAAPAPAPAQINDAAKPAAAGQTSSSSSSGSKSTAAPAPAASGGKAGATDDSSQSTSKEKKKKGWRKLIPGGN